MIKQYIAKIIAGGSLAREESERLFQIMANGGATPAQVAAVLTGLRMKGETVAEITGAAIALRAKMEKVNAPPDAIDVCGTGGDAARKNGGTLNVSTAVAIVAAACGVPVVKHGNKSVSSRSGSADVISELGVNLKADKARAGEALQEAGLCFLFAPLYHAAMRHIAPVRQELGIRTLFNMLGPLVNPAQPKYQLMGVYDRALLHTVAEVLRMLGSQKAWVVHGSDGMDEITLTGPSHIAELDKGEIRLFDLDPAAFGFAIAPADALQGGDAAYNARELSLLLAGKHSPYRDVVLLNAAAALVVAGKAGDVESAVIVAAEAIDSSRAKEVLAKLVAVTNRPV